MQKRRLCRKSLRQRVFGGSFRLAPPRVEVRLHPPRRPLDRNFLFPLRIARWLVSVPCTTSRRCTHPCEGSRNPRRAFASHLCALRRSGLSSDPIPSQSTRRSVTFSIVAQLSWGHDEWSLASSTAARSRCRARCWSPSFRPLGDRPHSRWPCKCGCDCIR